MTEHSAVEAMRQAQQERGEQLRALIISWHEDKTFLLALNTQQREIEEGTLEVNTDWGIMANEVYAAYTSQPRMTAWDDESDDEANDESNDGVNDGSDGKTPGKIILPS